MVLELGLAQNKGKALKKNSEIAHPSANGEKQFLLEPHPLITLKILQRNERVEKKKTGAKEKPLKDILSSSSLAAGLFNFSVSAFHHIFPLLYRSALGRADTEYIIND